MWYALCYDPIAAGSIDGTNTTRTPHDKAAARALSAIGTCKPVIVLLDYHTPHTSSTLQGSHPHRSIQQHIHSVHCSYQGYQKLPAKTLFMISAGGMDPSSLYVLSATLVRWNGQH
jgi:hypothetical protein